MKKILAFTICFLLILAAGCKIVPIENLKNEPVPVKPNGEQPSLSYVKKAIIKGCEDRGWIPESIGQKEIIAVLNVREHQARVKIHYTRQSYSISYLGSENLDYQKGKIHRNYNKWVTLLSKSIVRELGVHAQVF